MPTLTLFRHAKSSWSDPSLGDFNRPLAPRGRKAAPRMGRYLSENDLVPDLAICSTALRARETLELALPELDPQPEVRLTETLYHATAETLLEVAKGIDDGVGHTMLIGHNPGMHMMAHLLVASGAKDALDQLAIKFPTAAVAVFAFDGAWRDVRFGACELRTFVVPRSLSS